MKKNDGYHFTTTVINKKEKDYYKCDDCEGHINFNNEERQGGYYEQVGICDSCGAIYTE
jgi:uncharacterized protein with PIN domain